MYKHSITKRFDTKHIKFTCCMLNQLSKSLLKKLIKIGSIQKVVRKKEIFIRTKE
jgi:hypothetical protein